MSLNKIDFLFIENDIGHLLQLQGIYMFAYPSIKSSEEREPNIFKNCIFIVFWCTFY